MAQVVHVLYEDRVVGVWLWESHGLDHHLVLRRRNLLRSITPGLVGRRVYFGHDAIEIQVHSLLSHLLQGIAATTDVAVVTNDLDVREIAAQFNGDLPMGNVAVRSFAMERETAVDRRQAGDSSIVKTLDATHPQFEVRVYRVFYNYRDVGSLQGIGDFLNGKWVHRCTGTNPEYVDASLECFKNVLAVTYLSRHFQAGFFFDFFQPGQTRCTYAFELSRAGTWFPNPCAEQVNHAITGQLTSSLEDLLFGFCAARPRNQNGSFISALQNGSKCHCHGTRT